MFFANKELIESKKSAAPTVFLEMRLNIKQTVVQPTSFHDENALDPQLL